MKLKIKMAKESVEGCHFNPDIPFLEHYQYAYLTGFEAAKRLILENDESPYLYRPNIENAGEEEV